MVDDEGWQDLLCPGWCGGTRKKRWWWGSVSGGLTLEMATLSNIHGVVGVNKGKVKEG